MEQDSFVSIIKEQTYRALWEVKNVINSVPDELWNKCYCDMPCWKHIYHMLFSLSRWFMNPRDESFQPPEFHVKDLNDLDIVSTKQLSRFDINSFYEETEVRIRKYLD